MKKFLIFIFLLLFSTSFYCQENQSLKEDVSKLINAFNTNNRKVITDYVYPKVFEKGLSPSFFQISLAGIAALDRGTSVLNSENQYEIKNIDNHKFSVVKFRQSKSETLKIKKNTTNEELNLYLSDRKKQIEDLGFEFSYTYNEKKKVLVETIVLNNKLIAIADQLTENKWRFLFNWNMYEPAKIEEIFGDQIKKELGL